MAAQKDRLFSPRFFLMCGFSFTVFLSAFQLFPTAPFHIRDLGGSTFAAGLFMAFLTYSSAVTAPFTGALADKLGLRRTLITSAFAITLFSVGYALLRDHRLMLGLTIVHGAFWSGLLTASGAYMANILPPSRRAEGIGYWGFASVAAVVIAPSLGFWVYQFGWVALCAVTGTLNLTMAIIAWRLPPERITLRVVGAAERPNRLIEWRVMGLAVTLLLYSFSYGGLISFAAMYAEASGVTPRAIYLTVLSLAILATRPVSGALADRIGYERVLVPCLGLITVGLVLLQFGTTRPWHIASAVVFGGGYGSAYPIFAAYVLQRVDDRRRGAAFGAIIAAFDTGIGTGSLATGWLIQHGSYKLAFGVGAAVSALAIPYFFAARRFFASQAK
jgi:MFS family permease